jgi:septum formation topological specificity factor MinE
MVFMVDWIIFDLYPELKNLENLEKDLSKIVGKYKPYVKIKNNSIYVKVEELKREEWEKLEETIKSYLDNHKIPYDIEYAV